jgi:hypothetical protein
MKVVEGSGRALFEGIRHSRGLIVANHEKPMV